MPKQTFKPGDIVTLKRVLERITGNEVEPDDRCGVIVEFKDHDPARDHPWFGDKVVILWDDGDIGEYSARVVVHHGEIDYETG